MALKYSYTATDLASDLVNKNDFLEGLRGVAHISAPLESEAMCLMLQTVCIGKGKGSNSSTVPAALQSVLRLPLTLLLTAQHTLLVLIGAQVVKEVPLRWIDDLADDDSDIAATGARSGASAFSISTLHKDDVHFAVQFAVRRTFLRCFVLFQTNSHACFRYVFLYNTDGNKDLILTEPPQQYL